MSFSSLVKWRGVGGPLLLKARLEKIREQSLRGDSNNYSWRHFPSRGVE